MFLAENYVYYDKIYYDFEKIIWVPNDNFDWDLIVSHILKAD